MTTPENYRKLKLIPGKIKELRGGYIDIPLYWPHDLESVRFIMEKSIPGAGNYRVAFISSHEDVKRKLEQLFNSSFIWIDSEEKIIKNINTEGKCFIVKLYNFKKDYLNSLLENYPDFFRYNIIVYDERDCPSYKKNIFYIENFKCKLDGLVGNIGKVVYIALKRKYGSGLKDSVILKEEEIKEIIDILKRKMENIYGDTEKD